MLEMGNNSARSFAREAPRGSPSPSLGATLMRPFGTQDDRPDLRPDTSVPLGMRLGDLCRGAARRDSAHRFRRLARASRASLSQGSLGKARWRRGCG